MRTTARLADGTPVYHALGELPCDPVEDKVCCGLCGQWYRSLGPHLRQTHEWSAEEYRAAFGLAVQRPLQAPGVSEKQAASMKARIEREPRVREGMRIGLALARTGELNRLGRQADAERGRALERRERTRAHGRQLGSGRAQRYRATRDARAQGLGFASAEALLRERYLIAGAPVSELAAELDCAEVTVISEMDRFGIARRAQEERLALGRVVLAARRAADRERHEARARSLGFETLADYLRTRHHVERWPQKLIADELGISVKVVARLLRQCGVKSVRGLRSVAARPPT